MLYYSINSCFINYKQSIFSLLSLVVLSYICSKTDIQKFLELAPMIYFITAKKILIQCKCVKNLL